MCSRVQCLSICNLSSSYMGPFYLGLQFPLFDLRSILFILNATLCITDSRIEMVNDDVRAIHGTATPGSTHTMQLWVVDPLDTLIR